MKQKTERR